jgi:hypothetical protein
MYLRKSSKRKTFAPISAKRQKRRRIKRFFLFLIICLFLFLLFWSINKGFQYIFEHKSHWFAWKAKKLVVVADDDYTKQQIQDLISFKEDTLISSEDAKNIKNSVQLRLNQVQKVDVKRGFFSKELTVKTTNHTVLAKVETKNKSFLLSESGILFNYEQAKIPSESLKVKLKEEIRSSFLLQELVELLKDVKAQDLQDLDYIDTDLEKKTLTFYLKNGSIVDIGSFDLYNGKIVALKDIIDISHKKGIKEPYRINFKYFEDGKIYLNTQV